MPDFSDLISDNYLVHVANVSWNSDEGKLNGMPFVLMPGPVNSLRKYTSLKGK
jgi:hypothetical protein